MAKEQTPSTFSYSCLLMASVRYLSMTTGAPGRPVTHQVPWSLPLKVISRSLPYVSVRADREGIWSPWQSKSLLTLWPMQFTSRHWKLLIICSWEPLISEKLGYNIPTLGCFWIFSLSFIWIIQKEIKHIIGVLYLSIHNRARKTQSTFKA